MDCVIRRYSLNTNCTAMELIISRRRRMRGGITALAANFLSSTVEGRQSAILLTGAWKLCETKALPHLRLFNYNGICRERTIWVVQQAAIKKITGSARGHQKKRATCHYSPLHSDDNGAESSGWL